MEGDSNWRKWKIGLIIFGLLLTGFVLYQFSSSNKLLEYERLELKGQIKHLREELRSVKGISYKRRLTRDSLMHVIKPYMPYESVVKSMAQRDSIARLLPVNYGEMVYVLPDSAVGIVEGIVYGGNQFESYVKYKVLLKNNKYAEVNPQQVKKIY